MFDLGDLARFPPRFYRLLRLSATPPGRLSDLFSHAMRNELPNP